jgi:DNA-binding IclR family transcriptional regulator
VFPVGQEKRREAALKYLIPSLERLFRVLEFLANQQSPRNVTEISRALTLPKNSVFRICRTTLAFGYLEEHEKAYSISAKFFGLAYKGLRSSNLFLHAHDVMQDLREEVNETVMLGSLHGNSITILEVLPSFEYIRFQIEPGHVVPLHASAPGKAMLAFSSPQTQGELLEHMSFTRYTDKTIPGKHAMRVAMDQILKDGYATDEGEEVKNIHCIASPVFDYRGYAIASLWVSGPWFRLVPEKFPAIGKTVLQHALVVSKRMGFSPEFSPYFQGTNSDHPSEQAENAGGTSI